jgi:hypothetical protein
MTDTDHADLVERYTTAIADRVSFDHDLSQTPIADQRCAIVFVHAFWSMPSFNWLRHMAEMVAKHDPNGVVRFVVCDTDSVSQLSASPYDIDVSSGMGEILWIHDGVVRARHGRRGQCDLAITTSSLVAECLKECGQH